jgi:ribonuclease J
MDKLRIMTLGAFNTVTQNMFIYHYLPQGREDNGQILIVDVGVGFPEGDMPGVDLIIPDFSYVVERKDQVVGVVITHGHEDHIGALPLFMSQFKKPISIWAPKLATAMIEEKFVEFGIKSTLRSFTQGDKFSLGKFNIEPIRVTHSIPDSFHFLFKTPVGNFYHGADFKFDMTPIDGKPPEFDKISQTGNQRVIAMLTDCLGSEHPGFSPSEVELADMLENQIKDAKGRVFVTAISSNIYRWQQVISASVKYNRKIAIIGMSINKVIKIAREIGYLDFKDSHFIDQSKIKNFSDSNITVLVAGSLGQSGSSLEKIISGKHRIKIKPTDKVIFSSPDYIPGTTSAIYRHIDTLAKHGVDVVYGELEGRLHVSGHAHQQELALLVRMVKPKNIIPIGGNYRHMRQYISLIKLMGLDEKKVIIPGEDQVLVFDQNGLTNEILENPTKRVLVDGFGVGDVGQTVLRDRHVLAKDGMVVVVFSTDEKGALTGKPTVVTRGFVYVKESHDFINSLEKSAQQAFIDSSKKASSIQVVKQTVQGKIEELVYKQTGRQPMVIPVVIEV